MIRDAVIVESPTCRCPGYGRCRHEPGRCGRRSTQVDHIVRRREAGPDPDRRSNLQALCSSCHTQKTHVEVNADRERVRNHRDLVRSERSGC
ncbi:MAG: HNH endonuclease signature motif containing protein [Actinomycetota bacterium]